MAQYGARAGGEDRRQPPSLARKQRMPHGEHTAMHGMQSPCGEAAIDSSGPER
jgi:hypothetical protein